MPAPRKSNLVGGIVLCAFPATILLAVYRNGVPLPMPWPILFAVFFIYGLRAIATSLAGFDLDGTASWISDAIAAAGFALFAFWIAWHEHDGWSGGIPFLPHRWNQNLARALFACGGLLASLIALRCSRKALNRHRNKPDDAVRHV